MISDENKPVKRKPGRPKKTETLAAAKTDNGNTIKRKRGRPKGSGGNKRIDRTINTKPGENTAFLAHDMKIYSLPAINMEDETQVKDRIITFFSICTEDDIKPTIESLALAFNVSRFTLFDYISGRNNSIKNIESIHTLKAAYNLINSYYAHMMNNGKINPVAGIFMMKNNLGYKDTTDYIVSTSNDQQLNLTDITNRAGLLEE